MKIIIIKSCLNCPHMNIHNPDEDGGEAWCGDRRIGNMKTIALMDDYIDPECGLADVSDYGADVENMIRYCG